MILYRKQILNVLATAAILMLMMMCPANADVGTGGCSDLLFAQPCDPLINHVILPVRLQVGDTVGLVSSASRALDERIILAKQRIESLGLRVKEGKSIRKDYFDFAGTDQERAEDLHDMFQDQEVKAIFEVRGGWGSILTTEYLNYELIKANPKILIGFSDITVLLLAIAAKTGLITFHGPMGGTSFGWSDFTTNYLQQVLFAGEKVRFSNPQDFMLGNQTISAKITTVHSGVVRGRIFGGNLTLLSRMLHRPNYLPKLEGAILFVEDDEEPSRKIEGMLLELKDAGVLNKISGFIFGQCTKCIASDSNEKKLDDLLEQYIKPLGIPAWSGAMIGHASSMFTLPQGALVEIDADQGTITMLEDVVR